MTNKSLSRRHVKAQGETGLPSLPRVQKCEADTSEQKLLMHTTGNLLSQTERHVCGLWEETGLPGGNGEDLETLPRPELESNPEPFC